MNHAYRVALFVLGVSCTLLNGCRSYPERMKSLKRDIDVNAEGSARLAYTVEDLDGRNRLLALQESGRLAYLQGDYRASADFYQQAMAFTQDLEDRAVVQVREVAKKTLASTYGNDLAIDYPVIGFENMMLHVSDAFARLAIGDDDGFGVDVRNIVRSRELAKSSRQTTRQALVDSIAEKTRKEITEDESYKELLDDQLAVAAGVQDSTDNAYALYLAGLYYEMKRDWSNAERCYSQVARLVPANAFAANDAAWMRQGGRKGDGYGTVVIFFEDGYVPEKRHRRTEYNIHTITSCIIDIPYYDNADLDSRYDFEPLYVGMGGKRVAVTSPLADLGMLAAKAHAERMDGILLRQASRTTIKAMTRAAFGALMWLGGLSAARSNNSSDNRAAMLMFAVGVTGYVGMGIVNSTTERADQRSWLLLPRTAHMTRFKLRPGKKTLDLMSGEKTIKVEVEVKAGKTTIVHCLSVPGEMRAFARCVE